MRLNAKVYLGAAGCGAAAPSRSLGHIAIKLDEGVSVEKKAFYSEFERPVFSI